MSSVVRAAALVEDAELTRAHRVRHFRERLSALAGGAEFLSVAQCAQFFAVSRGHVYDLCAAGNLPFVELGGAKRIPVSWLAEWLADGGTRAERGQTVSRPHEARPRGVRSVRRWAQS